MSSATATARVYLPEAPALVAGVRGAVWITADGEIEDVSLKDAGQRARRSRPIVCHGPAVARRLCVERFDALDILELFAFVRPAEFCLPTPRGLAEALDLPLPVGLEAEAETLFRAARVLLLALAEDARLMANHLVPTAMAMHAAGWAWGPAALAAMGVDAPGGADMPASGGLAKGLRTWTRLGEWEDRGPESPPDTNAVSPDAAEARLIELLGPGAEERPEQARYTRHLAEAFAPPTDPGAPIVMLAEAGTGVGKTLGYVAPASVWAERNGAPVWVSTFTRNLQRQLDSELDKLFPDAEEKAKKVVIRKGRENYVCLLNLDDAVGRAFPAGGAGARAGDGVALGLVARWVSETRNGDMVGGDFPAWLSDLFGWGLTLDLTDTRGECIYSACDHFRRCFIERSIRNARRAEIVVANHALCLVQAARGATSGTDEEGVARLPVRYVFDEGHHLFNAADSAFSAHLSGREAADLRRWLVGAEGGSRSRARGLRARLDGLIDDGSHAGAEAMGALEEILHAARRLPGPGWRQRLAGEETRAEAEAFLAHARRQVLARADNPNAGYDLETGTGEPVDGLLDAADELAQVLKRIERPTATLVRALMAHMDDKAADLDTQTKNRIDATARTLEHRVGDVVRAWGAMLADLQGETPETYVDWFSVERFDGRDRDVGLHRHWVDPMQPFAGVMKDTAQGLVVTSATLRDRASRKDDLRDRASRKDDLRDRASRETDKRDRASRETDKRDRKDDNDGWASADIQTGARHFPAPALHIAEASPFDYENQTRVLIVDDVRKADADQVAAAYRELLLASGGGGLGLFTAISRLRATYNRIAAPLEDAGLPLYAQHVDAMDTGTLIDIFRAEENACLLGTDAVRDGVDVPGNSLRLIVFDRVPWSRRSILHRVRRGALGGSAFEDMQTRMRLKQAFGRLLRRETDRGVFVLLDVLPSRLLGAFPPGITPKRLGLRDAASEIRAFLGGGTSDDGA